MENFFIARTFNNFETFSETANSWDLDFIQLSPGDFSADFLLYGDKEFQIVEVCYNKLLHQRGSAPLNFYTFAIHHRTSAPFRWRYLDFPLNSIIIFPENNELQALSQPGHHPFALSVTETFLATVADEIGLPEPNQFIRKGEVTLCDPEKILTIQIFLESLSSIMRTTSGAFGEFLVNHETKWKIVRLFLLALASSTDLKPRKKRIYKNRIVNRVLDYVDSDLSVTRSIPELCRIAEVDERTLRNYFYNYFSISPKKYLNCYRLNVVRKALLTLDTAQVQIADTANMAGFWHMGQFAADYRKLFGELPSETLRKHE